MRFSMKKLLKLISLFLIIFIIAFITIDKTKTKDTLTTNDSGLLQKSGCLALTYHRVREDHFITKMVEYLTNSDELRHYSVYESEFEQHIQILKQHNATFVTPSELREFRKTGDYPKNCVLISFDDVDVSVYENAFPILKEYQIPFTLFVIAGRVGDPDFENLSLANWEQIQEMVNSGLATVGSHTYDMHYLVEDDPIFFDPKNKEVFLKDLIKSKETIEANLTGVEVVDFAYPYGEGKDELVPIIQEAGFLSAYILESEIISEEDSPFWKSRVLVDHDIFKEIVEPWFKSSDF